MWNMRPSGALRAGYDVMPVRPSTLLAVVALVMGFAGALPYAFGQHLSFGVIGGASLTDDFHNEVIGLFRSAQGGLVRVPTRFYSTSKDYIVGPKVELGLPFHLSVELDALYRPLNFTSAAVNPDGSLNSVSPNTVVTWEFPILGKYRLPLHGVEPFVEVGGSFRNSGNLNGASPSNHGFTLGAGVEGRLRKLRIAPRVRYTRWAADDLRCFVVPRSRCSLDIQQPLTLRNQAEFLVGFSF
jgi:hypothetical protein